ncbi:MAG TPA: PH domain-containing protein [Mycobacteriales bacterium]|nr:PH domain-containing protein [Mycobacteriales bacterium]
MTRSPREPGRPEEPAAPLTGTRAAAPPEEAPSARLTGTRAAAPQEEEPSARLTGDTAAAPSKEEPAARLSEDQAAVPPEEEPAAPRGGDQPAASPEEIVRARPVRLRRVAVAAAAAIVVTFVVVALLLRRGSSGEGVLFGTGDQVAMVALGLLLAGGVLLLARPSLVADAHAVHVRNIFVSHDLPWEVVREVAFRDGSPWATLELVDDERLALLAVQASDGERAVVAVRGLRALQARRASGEREDGASDGR